VSFRYIAIWVAVASAAILPIVVALNSPLLEWRDSVYIIAGFGGVIAMSLLLLQPMLAMGLLPGLTLKRGRKIHQRIGITLVLCVVVHVVGLWITSPPDVIDALLFVSATPFSIWGVIAMWSIFVSACLVVFRRKIPVRAPKWLLTHRVLAVVTVMGSVIHAIMIEGTMGTLSKSMLCALVVFVTGWALKKQKHQSDH